jgi:hypothetical protein
MNSRAAAGQILGSINTARVDPFAGLSKYSNELDARARADAEQAQRDILFKQAQDDRQRMLSERTAGDIINKTMLEAPQDRSGWITDLAKNTDINSIVLKGDAATGYTDESGKAITNPAEIARRQELQAQLGGLAGHRSQQETEVDRLTRAIGLANAETGVTPEKYRAEHQQAKAAEITASGERLKATETQIAGLRKDASDKTLELAKDLFKVNPGYSTTTVTDGGSNSSSRAGVSKEPFPKMTLSTMQDFEQKAKDKVSWTNMGPDAKAIAEAVQYGKDHKIPEIITMNAINNLTKLEFSGNTIPSANVIIETMKNEQEFFNTQKAEYADRQKARDASDSGPRTSTTTYSPASNPNEVEYRKLVNSTVGDIEAKKGELEKSLTRLKMSPKERQDAEGRDLIDALFRGSKQLPNEAGNVPASVSKDIVPAPSATGTTQAVAQDTIKGPTKPLDIGSKDSTKKSPKPTASLTADEFIVNTRPELKKDLFGSGTDTINSIDAKYRQKMDAIPKEFVPASSAYTMRYEKKIDLLKEQRDKEIKALEATPEYQTHKNEVINRQNILATPLLKELREIDSGNSVRKPFEIAEIKNRLNVINREATKQLQTPTKTNGLITRAQWQSATPKERAAILDKVASNKKDPNERARLKRELTEKLKKY